MRQFFQKRWFLLCLAVLIGLGLGIGMQFGDAFVGPVAVVVRPRELTALVLFLMAFSLDSGQLARSFRSPAPVVWGFAVNFGLIPLMGWGLSGLQTSPDFAIGLMIACSVPCTMAAASVWTRKAGGNDAVSLLVTVSTNGLCFLVTPFWLNLTAGGSVALDFADMFWRLVVAVLIPVSLGQLARQIPRAGKFATDYKTPIGVVAQACILALVFLAAARAGARLSANSTPPEAAGVALVWGTCIAVHLAAMAVAWFGGRSFGFSRDDCIAVAFAGSQKTLPIGVMLATDVALFGNPDLLGPGLAVPFAVFPMLMFHASQLFIDTAVADRFAAGKREPPPAAG